MQTADFARREAVRNAEEVLHREVVRLAEEVLRSPDQLTDKELALACDALTAYGTEPRHAFLARETRRARGIPDCPPVSSPHEAGAPVARCSAGQRRDGGHIPTIAEMLDRRRPASWLIRLAWLLAAALIGAWLALVIHKSAANLAIDVARAEEMRG